MAKIEEVTALLIDEITTFEKAVAKLKEESEKLKQQVLISTLLKLKLHYLNFLNK